MGNFGELWEMPPLISESAQNLAPKVLQKYLKYSLLPISEIHLFIVFPVLQVQISATRFL